jgi:hypothetical protein
MSVPVRIQRATRALMRLPARAARSVREQADSEEFARIDATLARLEGYEQIAHARPPLHSQCAPRSSPPICVPLVEAWRSPRIVAAR